MAVEFGRVDTGVVDRTSAIVVTSRIRVVVSEKILARSGDVLAIQPAIAGEAACPTAVTPNTTAAR